jgi:hypothetical protein
MQSFELPEVLARALLATPSDAIIAAVPRPGSRTGSPPSRSHFSLPGERSGRPVPRSHHPPLRDHGAEAVWWRCHRRIIADYLLARGERVLHILPDGRITPAKPTPGARRRPDGTLAYPAAAA